MNHSVEEIINKDSHSRVRIVLEGLLIGVCVGGLIVSYRYALRMANQVLIEILDFASQNIIFIAMWFGALVVMAFLVSLLLKKEPLISGSGIPQLEGELTGHISSKWWRVLLYKYLGGFISLFSGLSLGREGPSIQLGAMLGKGFSKIFKKSKNEERYLMTCGASAGLAAAFHAPLAGVMFAIEEVHKHFSIALLLAVMTSSLSADFFISVVLGMKPIFNFALVKSFTPEFFPFLVFLGIVLGVAGVIYNATLLKIQDLFAKSKLSQFQKLLIPFLLAGIIGFTYPVLLGGGDMIIEELNPQTLASSALLVLLVFKFLFSVISFSSGAPGGIFFPLLVLGSIIGNLIANIAIVNFGVDPIFVDNFIIVAMAGLFAAIVRAPVTGIILIFEMTGSLTSLLAISIVSIVAFIVAEILKSKPVYDSLLERLLERSYSLEYQNQMTEEKVLLSFFVKDRSYIAGKLIKDINWPDHVLLVSISRCGKEIIPNGSTRVQSGDKLLIICNIELQSVTNDYMILLTSTHFQKVESNNITV